MALLGVNWLTDIVAGVTIGSGWFLICTMAFHHTGQLTMAANDSHCLPTTHGQGPWPRSPMTENTTHAGDHCITFAAGREIRS
jgi:membrane-associated phospholipid phosphatase